MRIYKTAAATLVVSLLVCTALAQQMTKPVQTRGGTLTGIIDNDGVVSYLGIPFAIPPVGDLRWRPPQPAASWEGIRKADKFGASCAQPPVPAFLPWTEEFMTQGPTNEDCLFLNIWTTAKPGERQPVMVFIHGGGFGGGSGSIAVYNGSGLAKKGVVLVTVNYRVGAFGFLVHPELTKESEHHSSGNYGLLDQIAALEWVKQNISAFGGDPSRVTIFGQSAGAVSVIDLMKSPLARGLFTRAIVQSDPAVFMRGDPLLGSSSLAERELQGQNYAELLGAHSIAELRAMPADAFLKGSAFPDPSSKVKSTIYRGGPVIDGWVLAPHHPEHEVAVINGLVAGDANMMDGLGPPPPATIASFEESAQKNFGSSSSEFLELYKVRRDEDVPAARKASREDNARVSLGLWAADQMKRSPAVYTYFFDRAIPWPAHPEFGAFHTAEIPYIFQTLKVLDRPWQPADFKLSDTMSSYWTNFAKTGNPNERGLPEWTNHKPESYTTMELGEHTGAMPEADPARLQFFLEYGKKSGEKQ
jgi:para-nitrobenzyl esterase